jgi:hypothetical protein
MMGEKAMAVLSKPTKAKTSKRGPKKTQANSAKLSVRIHDTFMFKSEPVSNNFIVTEIADIS